MMGVFLGGGGEEISIPSKPLQGRYVGREFGRKPYNIHVASDACTVSVNLQLKTKLVQVAISETTM